MLGLYPYSKSIILTDDIFSSYGGHTGISTSNQRAAAYLIAEKRMTSHIGTFLLPTDVTGTYAYTGFIQTEHSYVNNVYSVKLVGADCNCDITYTDACAITYDGTYGCIFVKSIANNYCSCSGYGNSFNVDVSYNAGLTSGSSFQPDMLLALTIVADINLNEILDTFANESVGDIGVQKFSNQDYTEERVTLGRTALGTSARAQKAAQLVRQYQRRKMVSIG